jgi:hypothetical protein
VTGHLEIRAYQTRTPLQKRNVANMTSQLEKSMEVKSRSL